MKRFIALLTLFLLNTQPVFADQITHLITGSGANLTNSATRYCGVNGKSNSNASGNLNMRMIPMAGTISKLRVEVDAAPGVGKSWVFTLYKNGSATSITTTISEAETSDSDLTNSVSVAAGDYLEMEVTPSGTPTATTGRWGLEFYSSNRSAILSAGNDDAISNSATRYLTIQGQTTSNATENTQEIIFPTGGTIKNCYVKLNTAPGAGKSWVFTVRKNTGPTALSITIANTDTTGSDTDSFTVAAGDKIAFESVPSGTPTAPGGIAYGVEFEPTVKGESVYLAHAGQPDNTTTEWGFLVGRGGFGTTEAQKKGICSSRQAATARKIYVAASAAPGAGKSYVYTMRANGGDSSLTVTLSDSETSDNVTNVDQSIAISDDLNWQETPSGTPTAGQHSSSCVAWSRPRRTSAS